MEKVLDAKIYRAVQPPPGRKEMLHCSRYLKLDWGWRAEYYIWWRGASTLARG